MPTAVFIDCVGADAFEDRVRAEAAGQLHHALHGLIAALAHHVGGAERLGQRNPVRMATQDDDLLGAKPLRRDDAAEATAPSPTTATVWPGPTLATTAAWWPVPITSDSVSSEGISASSAPTGSDEQRPVGLRDPQRFGLGPVQVVAVAEEADVDAGGRAAPRGRRRRCRPRRRRA